MSDSFTTELLREMENSLTLSEDEISGMMDVQYTMVPGLRENSEILWAFDEQQMYYKNSFSQKTQCTAYTCRVKGCTARLFVRPDKTAYRTEINHLNSHGSQYKDFKLMYCDNQMKQRAKTAPASMAPYDIYMEVVAQ